MYDIRLARRALGIALLVLLIVLNQAGDNLLPKPLHLLVQPGHTRAVLFDRVQVLGGRLAYDAAPHDRLLDVLGEGLVDALAPQRGDEVLDGDVARSNSSVYRASCWLGPPARCSCL